MQVSGAQVVGSRCQVSGSRFRMSGVRCQVSDARLQVSGTWFHVHAQGLKDQIAVDHVSDFRDLIQRQNVENLHIKNILRINGNFELTNTFFTMLIFSLACFKR